MTFSSIIYCALSLSGQPAPLVVMRRSKQRHNFGLKSGETKFEAPRIKTPKASKGWRMGERYPSPAD